MEYLTRAVGDPTGARQIIDGLLAKGAASRDAEVEALRRRVAELETFAYGCDAEGCVVPHSSWCEVAKKSATANGGCTCPQPWKDTPQPHAGYCWLVSPPRNEAEEMRKRIAELDAQAAVVAEFVAARAEYITAIENCHPDNARDYERWQGHAESRRQLAQKLGLPVAWPQVAEGGAA